jgi:hypothetical protein
VGDFHKTTLHRRGRADEERGRVLRGGCGSGRGARQLANRFLHFAQVQRFHEVSRRAEFFCGDGVVEIAMRSDDERRQTRCALADFLEDFEAAHVGQADVENGEGEFPAGQFIEPAPAAGR